MLAEASDARDALEARQGRFSAANESLQNDLRVARSQALFLDSMRASLASQLMRDEDAAAAAVEEKAAEIEFRKQTGGWEYCSANSPPPPITLKDPVGLEGVVELRSRPVPLTRSCVCLCLRLPGHFECSRELDHRPAAPSVLDQVDERHCYCECTSCMLCCCRKAVD